MGIYVITIVGQGAHDTPAPEEEHQVFTADADRLAASLVAVLKARGHRIYDASFVAVAGEGARKSLES